MNYLILLLILLLTTPCIAQEQQARMSIGMMGGAVAAASCTTSNDSAIVDKTGLTGANDFQSAMYLATKITISATTTITEYKLIACGYSGVNYTVQLWTNGADVPGTAIADTGKTKTLTPDCGTPAEELWTLTTPKTGISSGTYWIVLKTDGGNYNKIDYGADTGGKFCSSGDGVTWVGCNSNYSFKMGVWGCQ